MRELITELRERMQTARAGGGERAVERHRSRGKLTARERIDLLLDPETAFLELSPLAATGVYEDEPASAGIVTGIGQIHERHVMLVASDAAVKGGAYYPLTVKMCLFPARFCSG
jgi:3-methylcrotonyl-CoA carboxylase beta subunit